MSTDPRPRFRVTFRRYVEEIRVMTIVGSYDDADAIAAQPAMIRTLTQAYVDVFDAAATAIAEGRHGDSGTILAGVGQERLAATLQTYPCPVAVEYVKPEPEQDVTRTG